MKYSEVPTLIIRDKKGGAKGAETPMTPDHYQNGALKMATSNVNETRAPSADYTNERLKRVFEGWSEEREQIFALVAAIETHLRPDPKSGLDSDNINAWRLAQVATDLLGDTANFSALEQIVGVAS